ncbi:MAG TPA: hypothetical protein PK041_07350 [Kaistella sp.]|nr:hypothetical protein [Kaistella sp.]
MVPPKNVVTSRVASEILARLFLAKNLSVPNTAKLVTEMKSKYITTNDICRILSR